MIRKAMLRSCSRTQCSPALVIIGLVVVLVIAFVSYRAVVLATALWTVAVLVAVGLGFAGRAVLREARHHRARVTEGIPALADMPSLAPVQAPQVADLQAKPTAEQAAMQAEADRLAHPATALAVGPDGSIIQS